MRFGGQCHTDLIADPHCAAPYHHGHHAIAEQHRADLGFERHRGPQSLMGPIDLGARVTESGECDDGIGTQAKRGAHRQLAEFETTGGDVLAEPATGHIETVGQQSLVHLASHEMHLTQIRPVRVLLLAAQMLRGGTSMGVTLDADTGDEGDLLDGTLGEGVIGVAVETHDGGLHRPSLAARGAQMETISMSTVRLMSLRLDTDRVEPMVAALLGAIDVDGGATAEQLAILGAITAQLWERPALDLHSTTPLGPAAAAAALDDRVERRTFHEILVALEACRHPLSVEQIDQAERYNRALSVSGAEIAMFRDLVQAGAERAAADFARFLDATMPLRFEPTLRDLPVSAAEPEPELIELLFALQDLPEGTLGREFFDFHARNGLPVPGVEGSTLNHFYVSHDMTHVIAGIGTTAAAEVALSAFQMAMNDNDANVAALLSSLIVHEVGFGSAGKVASETHTLASPGAAELLASELARGAHCTADFSIIDHLAIAEVPLAEVRAQFGVQPPIDPDDGHHHW